MPPDPAHSPAPPDHGAARIARVLAIAGGVVVVGLAGLVTTSVLLRWLGGQGINGDFEMVQTGLALAVFAFLPLCQAHRGNVMVDTFTARLPLRLQYALDALWDGLYAAFAGFIAWRLAIGAIEARTSGTTSMVLGLPIHYAIGGCAAMAAFLALICVLTAIRRGRQSA
ncbi:MAG TPA: TRAP transporter small permease [Microvirga sp.]|jgi:TRAP-type C4-dicarboxylate transport system permease small subunit|nr:TRAP transporter small permease [Microvirga sp.]